MPLLSGPVRAVTEVIVGAAALLVCAATSSPEPGEPEPEPDMPAPEEPFAPDLRAHIVIHNALPDDVVVRLRRLAPAVDTDCDALLEDPGALVSEALLGPTESWTIPAGDNLGLDATNGRTCEVIRLEGDGFAPRWLVWDVLIRPSVPYAADLEPEGDGVVRLVPEGTGVAVEGEAGLVFAPADLARADEQCAPVPDGRRIDWGDPIPEGGVLLDARWGPDGCGSVVFSPDGEVPATPWFLCIPQEAWPFEVGESVELRPDFGTAGDALELVAHGAEDEVRRRLRLFRVSSPPSFDSVSLRYRPDQDCGYDVERTCGTVTRVGHVIVTTDEDAEVPLEAGEVFEGVLDGVPSRIEVLTAQTRYALDPECAQGPDTLGPDLAVVVTEEMDS